jgi:nucleoside-diphosphate-sugar epimerase
MKVLVTGGCGYKGSVLVPKLLHEGYEVIVVDTCWFGNYLGKHKNLTVINEDIRNIDIIPLGGIEAIIHLANIANDPSVELNPYVSWEVNVLATMRLADKAVRENVKQFIFASSSSVYGVKEELNVTEELTLQPISEYNKTKMVVERVLLSYRDDMVVQIVRPATVCGFSPRMRLDVSVNMLTMQALQKKEMTVFGGKQVRPNIHIEDITDLYLYLLKSGGEIEGIFNAGFENLSILEIAERVVRLIPSKISIVDTNDPRSYRVNSDKLLSTGFVPQWGVDNAIEELVLRYSKGELVESPKCYNVAWMKERNYM